MKCLKVLGLAAIAAVSLLAFGAGTTSATTLFTDSAKTIKYPANTTIEASLVTGTTANFTAPPGTVAATCSGSNWRAKTGSETATWIEAAIETLDWSGCTPTVDTVVNGAVDIMWAAGSNGELVGTSDDVTLVIGPSSCSYGAGTGTVYGNMTGGSAPIWRTGAELSKVAGGFLCPSKMVLDAEYVVTAPHALFFGS